MARARAASAGHSVEVRVELKGGVMDAEAEGIKKALGLLGVPGLSRVGVARVYTLEFDDADARTARARAEEAVERLLANPVIHRVEIHDATRGH